MVAVGASQAAVGALAAAPVVGAGLAANGTLTVVPAMGHGCGTVGAVAADVVAAESIGYKIKLLGRCIAREGKEPFIMVAPFLLPDGSPLAGVNGVYNAVEVIAEPIGNAMFYGLGAGKGTTASAVVGDLIPIIAYNNKCPIIPGFNKTDYSAEDAFAEFESKNYIAIPEEYRGAALEVFGEIAEIDAIGEMAFVTDMMSEAEVTRKLDKLGAPVLSRIRFI